MIPHIKTSTGISLFLDGKPYNVANSADNYKTVLEYIRINDVEKLKTALHPIAYVVLHADGIFTMRDDGTILIGDRQVAVKGIFDRITMLKEEGLPTSHVTKFVQKLSKNPTPSAVEELYLFMEACDLPITEEGDFLAYKVVRSDYLDKHSGRIKNNIGCKPAMERSAVNPNRNQTCSSGLHFCSYNYIKSFKSAGDRLMVVKVNPADVVSIPSDYNNTKGRAWTYEVVAEIPVSGKDAPAPQEVIKHEAEKNFTATPVTPPSLTECQHCEAKDSLRKHGYSSDGKRRRFSCTECGKSTFVLVT